MIPNKMSKIASQIPELPILNEPLPVKPLKKPREKKPPKEKARVAKSKFSKELVALMKKEIDTKAGPKTDRLLKKMKEFEAENATSSFANTVIKNEPLEITADTDSYTVHVNEYGDEEATAEEMEQTKNTNTESKDMGNKIASFEQKSAEAPAQTETLQQKRIESEKNVTVENTVGQRGDTTGEGQKPLIIAVPVMIAGVQQVACIPFYPDKDGIITLPNGKKIDASSADAATQSLPLIDFDQPLQVLNPSQQTSSSVPSAEQQQTDAVCKKPTSATSRDSISLLNLKTTQTNRPKQVPLQNISLLNQSTVAKNTVTTNSSSSQTSSTDTASTVSE